MALKFIPLPYDSELMSSSIIDAQVMSTFLSIEFGYKDGNSEATITLRDKTIMAVDTMITKDLMPGLLVIFQIQGHAAAIPIAWVGVQDDRERLMKDLQKIFEWPEVTIDTGRKIYLETDTSKPIGVQRSYTIIPSSMLDIFVVETGDFGGSWRADNQSNPIHDIITHLDTLPDDPRDMKL